MLFRNHSPNELKEFQKVDTYSYMTNPHFIDLTQCPDLLYSSQIPDGKPKQETERINNTIKEFIKKQREAI